jgi:peptidoglycan hydrolase CwlO-like protein
MQRWKLMSNKKDFDKEIKKFREQIKKAKEEKEKLQDEVDSLWAMMDEMTKTDIKNWAHILNKLEKDTEAHPLMITKKVADA